MFVKLLEALFSEKEPFPEIVLFPVGSDDPLRPKLIPLPPDVFPTPTDDDVPPVVTPLLPPVLKLAVFPPVVPVVVTVLANVLVFVWGTVAVFVWVLVVVLVENEPLPDILLLAANACDVKALSTNNTPTLASVAIVVCITFISLRVFTSFLYTHT